MEKSDGLEIIEAIKNIASKYGVPNGNITYDSDGVGGFIEGFIQGAHPFKNGRSALRKENYENLKSQMYYKMGDRISRMGYYVTPEVRNKRIGTKTFEQHVIEERRAIKRDKPLDDGKLRIIPKSKMIEEIIGHSPDFMDAWMMREYFEFVDQGPSKGQSKAGLGFF